MPSSPSLVGATLGAYRLTERLGAGGMGEVYRAVHTRLDRTVAIKLLSGAAQAPAMVERFRHEARLQSSLHHPNVVTLYDFFEFEGRPCIVMEYVDGETLDDLVRRSGGVPVAEALAMLAAAARATGYLHAHGILHRDLKCANIKRNAAGTIKLLDFGLAKGPVTPKFTATGHVVGTFDYMAPEQLTRAPLDERTDVWALGVVLYELVTGRLPFAVGGTLERMSRVVEARYVLASTLRPGIPRGLDAIIARCLHPDPAGRYRSVDDLAAAAEALLGESAPGAATKPARPLARRLTDRLRELRRLAPVVALVGGLVAAFWWWSAAGPPPAEPPVTAEAPPAEAGAPCGVSAAAAATDRSRMIELTVVGGAADVYCDDRRIGRTPFRFPAELGGEVRLTLREQGWLERPIAFTVSEGTRILSYVLQRAPGPAADRGASGPPPRELALAAWWSWLWGWRRRRQERRPVAGVTEPADPMPRPTSPGLQRASETGALRVEVRSDPGCVREGNEDTIGFWHPADAQALDRDGVLLVVADGMGGHSAGEVASRLAVEVVTREYNHDNGDPQVALIRAIQSANETIRRRARADTALKGMGTTCTALVVRQGWAYCAHVGDSRLYLVRAETILQLTEDHSAVFSLVKRGVIARADARAHPDRNVIVRALGSRSEVEVASWAQPLPVWAGDRFVVSSDGLHDLVPDGEIQETVSALPPAAACDHLVALARARGGHDNISVGILSVGEPSARIGDLASVAA